MRAQFSDTEMLRQSNHLAPAFVRFADAKRGTIARITAVERCAPARRDAQHSADLTKSDPRVIEADLLGGWRRGLWLAVLGGGPGGAGRFAQARRLPARLALERRRQ